MRSATDALLANPNCIDLLLYIRDHPGCRKTEIGREVTCNQTTVTKLWRMHRAGLLVIDAYGDRWTISLSGLGEEVAGHLAAVTDALERNGASDGADAPGPRFPGLRTP